MGALAGFILGYVLGMKQGPEGFAEMRTAWEQILGAPEVKALPERAPSIADLTADGGNGLLAHIEGLVEGNEQLAGAWRAPAGNEAVHSVVATGLTIAGGMLERGMALVSGARSAD
jgi:hypothetical protein